METRVTISNDRVVLRTPGAELSMTPAKAYGVGQELKAVAERAATAMEYQSYRSGWESLLAEILDGLTDESRSRVTQTASVAGHLLCLDETGGGLLAIALYRRGRTEEHVWVTAKDEDSEDDSEDHEGKTHVVGHYYDGTDAGRIVHVQRRYVPAVIDLVVRLWG